MTPRSVNTESLKGHFGSHVRWQFYGGNAIIVKVIGVELILLVMRSNKLELQHLH